MSDHLKVLRKALEATKERGQTYDTGTSGVEENFTRAAAIASLWISKPITARDVAMILASVKMARIAVSPGHEDSFVDLVNYVAFASAFSMTPTIVKMPPANGQFDEKKFGVELGEAVDVRVT